MGIKEATKVHNACSISCKVIDRFSCCGTISFAPFTLFSFTLFCCSAVDEDDDVLLLPVELLFGEEEDDGFDDDDDDVGGELLLF